MTTSSLNIHKVQEFAEQILSGHIRAGARLMRLIDDQNPLSTPILKYLYRELQKRPEAPHVVGLTGNPGAGKSTLAAALVGEWRKLGRKVGVIAIDPSSPFSGGAILGDRIRMVEHSLDDGVFIRSVATRGHLGGLSASSYDLVLVFQAMGYDTVLIETVGVGQDEVEVVKIADTTCVVMVPGLGDEIQALKAGILEIADLFILNKADRDGVYRTEKDLRMMQSLKERYGRSPDAPKDREIPIIKTIGTERQGIARLVEAIDVHRAYLDSHPSLKDALAKNRVVHLLQALIREKIQGLFQVALASSELQDAIARILSKEMDPWTEAEVLLAEFLSAPS